jgi:hypothetical protein
MEVNVRSAVAWYKRQPATTGTGGAGEFPERTRPALLTADSDG